MTQNIKNQKTELNDFFKLNPPGVLNEPVNTPEKIEKVLKYDNPGGGTILRNLAGAVKSDKVTNAVSLKKSSYNRGR